MKFQFLTSIVLVIASFACGFCLANTHYLEPMPKREALEFLDYAAYCHQYYADHPESCSEVTGDVEWNRGLVEKYNRIIALIR